MGDLKPIGSEKLQGQEKIKRILELAYYQNNDNDKKIASKHEYITEGVNGCFGIDKEKDGYYVKKGLTEETLDYIGGMFMKNKNKFNSYGDALKRLELLKSVELNEATKYVLKKSGSSEPAPAPAPAPIPEPSPEPAPVDDTEMPVDDTSADGEDNVEDNDPIKSIQKLTGKLGQKLRDFDADLESEDIKFVLNSIISAVDVSKISEEDKDDILNNFDETEDDNFDSTDINTDDSELEEVDDEYGFKEMEDAIDTDFEFEDDIQADAEYNDEEYADEYPGNEETPDYPGDAGVPNDEIDASELDNFEFKDEQIYDNSELDEIDDDFSMEDDEYTDNESDSNIDIEKLTNLIAQAVKASLK